MSLDDVELRVIAFKDGEQWVAQCLEHDIAAQASDLNTLHHRMHATIMAEIEASPMENGSPLSHIQPAPDYFLVMWVNSDAKLSFDNSAGGPHVNLKLAA